MRFITLFSIIWLSIVCQNCLNASDVSGEDSGVGVVDGNVPTNADLLANVEENDPIQEANAVQSEGHELPLFHEHAHPQRQSSVMPGRRKRQSRAPQVTGVPRGPAPQVTGVGRRKRRQTDRMANVEEAGPTQEANVVAAQSEGSQFAAPLNSGKHFQPQNQSSVMPRRKRQSPSIIVQPRPSIIVGRRKRRQTVEEGAEGNRAQQNDGNSNNVHYVIAPGDGLEFTCQAASNVQQIQQQNVSDNQMNRNQGEERDAPNSGNKVAGAGAIPVISGNTLRVVCKV